MAAKTIRTQGSAPSGDELQRAYQINRYTHASADSLLQGFNSLGQARGPGAPSDEQQDLLRAMLLFAGAGLDACAQQVVRDALPRLVEMHPDARSALITSSARRMRKSGDSDAGGVDTNFLAAVLLGDPEENLIEDLITNLTGSSMQSVEELKKVAGHLGVTGSSRLMTAIEAVREPLQVRNRIAHDMDIKITATRGRNRVLRKRADMVNDTNALLKAAEELIIAVDQELH